MGLVSEFFQTPSSINDSQHYHNPIPANFFNSTVKISLKNRLGSFQLEQFPPRGKHALWMLNHPRRLPANFQTVQMLFSSLQELQIRKIFARDAINMANFSLETPLLNIKLENQEGEVLKINMGIVNPIDNSTYIFLDNKKIIYQVDTFKHSLETFGLADFIDSHVFSGTQQDILNIDIYKGKKEGGRPYLSFNQKSGQWFGQKNLPLSVDKMDELIRNILSVKGQIILDRKSEGLEKMVQKYLSSPLYTIELKEKDGISKSYVVSTLISGPIPELKIEDQQNLMIMASDREHPYVIGKDYLAYFSVQEQELKKTQFNNLFY